MPKNCQYGKQKLQKLDNEYIMPTMTQMAESREEETTCADNGKTGTPTHFKKTEVGLIPDDWDLIPMGLLVKITSGESPSRQQFKGEGIPYFKVEQLNSSNKYLENTPYHFMRVDKKISSGSVIFPKRGASIFLNKVNILLYDSFMDTNLMTLTPKNSLDSEYLYYALKHIQLWRIADTTSIPQINNKHIQPLLIPISPVHEQKAIAKTLSDVDALLEGLDKLIAKKRAIKQASMQQLLTGKRRLPGFAGKWEVKCLGNHVKFLRNGVNSRAELTQEGAVRYLHYGEIHACSGVRLDAKALPALPKLKAKTLDRLHEGDLVFADASEDMSGVAKSVEVSGLSGTELVSGLHTIAARFDKDILANGFKAYLQFCSAFSAPIRRLAAGTKVYAISRSHIASVEMPLPSIEEQKAIAAVLSDMDKEIAALEALRDKTKALKQGMMQELLTGRIRLV